MATNIANNEGNSDKQKKLKSTGGSDKGEEGNKDNSGKLHSIDSPTALIHDFKLRDFYLAIFVLVICIKFNRISNVLHIDYR